MNIKEIKDLIGLMNEQGLTEFEMEKDGFKIKLKKGGQAETMMMQSRPMPYAMEHQPRPAAAELASGKAAEAAKDEVGVEIVRSPMVGTFYKAAAPDADPFVSPGDNINKDETLCIIESMKLMNEIKSELRGVIVEILVENGQSVEFDQPLFKIKVSQ